MPIRIALAGNPNCGKTTVYNALTGASQYVGNWPGVTVEKKEGKLRGNREATLVDLPGIYSLSPYTLEEVVARNFLLEEKPDAILNIVDASNLERNLYLTTQLLEIGIPTVVALNLMDVVRKSGDQIDIPALSKALGCPVAPCSAVRGEGLNEAVDQAIAAAQAKARPAVTHTFSQPVERALTAIGTAAGGSLPRGTSNRWVAIKLFERDQKLGSLVSIPAAAQAAVEAAIVACEREMDDDAESIVTNERYEVIARVVAGCYRRARGGLSTSDKIDRVVTNRILALPIFMAVMFLVYYLSVSTLGALGSDWVNDVLFGEIVPNALTAFMANINAAEWLTMLVRDGIAAGVGSVLGFLPQMLVLFFCLALLEDCGYMARIAFIMDRIFRKFGLSGK
ncbi:MAG: ferrous iron transport protein B, partial [Clostridiales bacterium]|nr:ferrous iron transport protein B [Clostridiales bacterium]